MKKFWKGLVSGVFCGVLLTLSGCFLSFDPESPSSSTQLDSLEGFKICYNNNSYELDTTFEDYSQHFLTEMFANFAMPSNTTHTTKVEDSPLANNAKNFDRIRVQVDTANDVVDTSWKWTLSQNLTYCESQFDIDNTLSYFTQDRQETFFTAFVNTYKIPLAVIAIQIAMNVTPEEFNIQVGTPTVVKTKAGTTVDENYLATIKAQFKSQGLYVGFTTENVATFKNYILTKIVGEDVVDNPTYNKIYTQSGTTNYAELLDKILAVETGLEKEFLNPYPASFVKDVTDSSCYAQNAPHTMDHVDSLEYHSVIVMVKKQTQIAGIVMGFESTYNLTLNIKVTYYSSALGASREIASQTIAVTAGAFSDYNWQMIDFNGEVDLNIFDNTLLKVDTPTQISNLNHNSKYYSYTTSGATLDKEQISCDFLSISFNPQKTTANEYCPFKWVIDPIIGE